MAKNQDVPEAGTRLSIWVPERYYWFLTMLENDVKAAEGRHEKASKGSVALSILLNHYEEKLRLESEKPHEERPANERLVSETIGFRQRGENDSR